MTPDISPTNPAATTSEDRWNAWIAKGTAHDRRLRGKLLIVVPILCLAAALAVLLLTGVGG